MLRERVIRLRGSSGTHRPFPLRHLVCRLTAICSARGLPLPFPPFLSPSPTVLRCLPRITVSCPSRIRICPRIRHVWGPDRIYRALNAAYRKSISGSHSQQQLLFISLPPARSLLLLSFLYRAENFLFPSFYRIGRACAPPFCLSHFFRLISTSRTSLSRPFRYSPRISVCQFFPRTRRRIFQRAAPLLREPPLNSSLAPFSSSSVFLAIVAILPFVLYYRNQYGQRDYSRQ